MSGLVQSGTKVKNITVTTNKERAELYKEQQRQQQQQQREAEAAQIQKDLEEQQRKQNMENQTTITTTQPPAPTSYWMGAAEGMSRAAQKQADEATKPKPPQTIDVTIAGRPTTLTYQKPKSKAPIGPTETLRTTMSREMGPAPATITDALRGFRDTIVGGLTPEPFRRAEESMSRVQDRGTSSFLQPSRQAKTVLDAPIGVIKGGESLVNPNARTASGAIFGTGLQGFTSKGAPFNPFVKTVQEPTLLKDYGKSIEGREGELFGEIVFDVGLGVATGRAAQKFRNVRVGSKTDEFLLQHSKRYRAGAENVLKTRPNIVGSPVFDVGKTGYTWSPARQRAIDTAFSLELTAGSSGVTVPALTETATKTKIIPSLWIRGGQVLGITDYRNYGFNKFDESLQNAPQQLGIQTTLTRESRRGLPYMPTRLAASALKTPTVTTLLGTVIRGFNLAETQKPKTTPQKPVGPTLTTEPELIPSERNLPYIPEPVIGQVEKQQDLPVPRLPSVTQIPEPKIVDVPKQTTIPELGEVPAQDQPEIVLPKTTPFPVQVPKPVLDIPQPQIPKVPTPQFPKTTITNKAYPIPPLRGFSPSQRSRSSSSLFGGYRLKTHKALDPKQLLELGKKTKPKRRGKKNAVEKVLF